MAVSLETRVLSAQGIDIIDLAMVKPDFDSSNHIIEAAYQANKLEQTRYTTADGAAATKAPVIEKYRRDNGLNVTSVDLLR